METEKTNAFDGGTWKNLTLFLSIPLNIDLLCTKVSVFVPMFLGSRHTLPVSSIMEGCLSLTGPGTSWSP